MSDQECTIEAEDLTATEERISRVTAEWSEEEWIKWDRVARKMARTIAKKNEIRKKDIIEQMYLYALTHTIPDAVGRYRQSDEHTASESTYVHSACKIALPRVMGEAIDESDEWAMKSIGDGKLIESASRPTDDSREQEKERNKHKAVRDQVELAPDDAGPLVKLLLEEVERQLAKTRRPVVLGSPDRIDPETGEEQYYAYDWQGEPVYFSAESTKRMVQNDDWFDAMTPFFDQEFLLECLANGEKQYIIAELMSSEQEIVNESKVSRMKSDLGERLEKLKNA